MQYAKAMGFRVIAIDAGSEKQDMCLNTLGAEEFVDFAKGDVVVNVKICNRRSGCYAVILLAVSEKHFQQAAEAYISWNHSILGGYWKIDASGDTREAIHFFARGLLRVTF